MMVCVLGAIPLLLKRLNFLAVGWNKLEVNKKKKKGVE